MPPSKTCVKRLQKEYRDIVKNPVSFLRASPREDNILEWLYVIYGLSGCYSGGMYHGILRFPNEYPYKPPSLSMLTPSGRFHTNRKLCLSFTDFHPESWNPMWSVSTILAGLVSFFSEESVTHGSMRATPSQRKNFAKKSAMVNLRNKLFCTLFPELVDSCRQLEAEYRASLGNGGSTGGTERLQSTVTARNVANRDSKGKQAVAGGGGDKTASDSGKVADVVFLALFIVFSASFCFFFYLLVMDV